MKPYKLSSIFVLVVTLFQSPMLLAQKESAIWYFGENAGLDFNSGSPVALLDGQLNTLEGCATICDSSGNLLFYTDGTTVWDKSHNIMPNGTGLFGDSSSTQSSVVVPKPNNPNIYYIFTVDNNAQVDGLRYSELDLKLNGNKGDITINKNIELFTPTAEKITAIGHGNGKDFWIISHEWETNNFLSYKITSLGVNTTPIISSLGSIHNGASTSSIGYLKVSPNGKKIALAKLGFESIVEVFDFDIVTGTISNPILIDNMFYDIGGAYGIEFSEDSNLLYVSDRDLSLDAYESRIYQFNISLEIEEDIKNSGIVIYVDDFPMGAIQLALDGRIYIVRQNATFIDIIENPNIIGFDSNYKNKAIDLKGRQSKLGLPTYIQSFFGDGVETEDLTEYPKFFTPNNDGNHDYWQINLAIPESNIKVLIFNRYGKLLKELNPNSQGWDGTFNGELMPSSDYWFVVSSSNRGLIHKGHFTLKR